MSVSKESKEQEYDKLTLNVNAVKRYKLNKLINKKNIKGIFGFLCRVETP